MTPLFFVGSLAAAMALGTLIVETLWRQDASPPKLPMMVPLAILVGLATSGGLYFALSLVTGRPAVTIAGELTIIGIGFAWRWRARRPRPAAARPARWTTLQWVLATVLAQTAVVAAIIGWRAYRAEPFGGWDGWAIWNLHARFLQRAGAQWPELLNTPQLSWSHPDYPWLVPASVARAWAWTGGETAAASAAISAVFAVAATMLLIAVVARLRHSTAALLAGLVLIGTPFFVTFSTNQHADIPFAAYLFAAVSLLAVGQSAALAGLCAAFAAWTKNEGVLAAVVIAAVHLWRTRKAGWPGARPFVLALAAGLVPLIYFKVALAPPSDLLAAPLRPRLGKVFDLSRHATIWAAVGRDIRGFGEWHWLPYFGMALPFAAWRCRRSLAETERTAPWVLGLMALGYYTVYLLTPQDLGWHLETSLVRLLLQLWPLAILIWALMVPIPQFVAAEVPRRWTRIAFIIVNAAAALLLVGVLDRQLAPGELALSRRKGQKAILVIGEGWHPVEQAGRQRWAWSRGTATLRFESDASSPSASRTLKFTLRSLVPRQITIRVGDRILWLGSVGEAYVPVVLRDVPLGAAATRVTFSTDAAAVREPATAGARELAFAIYNVTID